MESNKDEGIRAKELAEKKLAENDAIGAKRFALKAQKLYPELDGLPQLLATVNIYISADAKINGEVDWYRVLGVQPHADEDTIRKHYRKLALMLHPDKNKSVGADGAFRILSEAWNFLSDKAKRNAYDQKHNFTGISTNVLNGKLSSSSVRTSRNDNKSNATDLNSVDFATPAPPDSARKDTFWTICNSCKTCFQYPMIYVNKNLPCVKCRTPFLAVEMASPPTNGSSKYTPVSDSGKQEKFTNSYTIGQRRSSGLNSSTKDSQKGAFLEPGSNINVASPSSFTAQAAAVNHSASETLESGHIELQAGTMRKESLPKFHPSQKTDAALGTGSSGSVSSFAAKKHRPKKIRRDETGMGNNMAMGNERASSSSFQKSGFKAGRMNVAGISGSNRIKEPSHSQLESRNILIEMAQKRIRKEQNSWKLTSLSNASEKPIAFDKRMEEKDERSGKYAPSMKPELLKSVKFVDVKSNVDSDIVSATKEPEPRAMNVPDPDFHDFDKDRTEKSFGENQVWAAYDDDDGMPRYYAMIHSVISLKPFKMRMSWLNSKSNLELAPLNWIGSGFYKTSGDFWIGKHVINRSLNSFSHKVKWSKARKGAVQIYPKKGDVWALYRNWSCDWSETTADEVIHKYDMVKVLDDYNERKGVLVAPLVKVPGFKTVFQKHSEPSKTWMIPREELFRFSHQVPSYLLTGQEGPNAPKDCLELDPAATPSELLQVFTEAQVKEMEEINKKAQGETVSVEQAVMEQEIKEENEHKKPGMLVYSRRRQKKQKNYGNIIGNNVEQ
ncbi:hypothetical protein DITRI_Ditri04bG0021900 [Diplodiscus trichospermus]